MGSSVENVYVTANIKDDEAEKVVKDSVNINSAGGEAAVPSEISREPEAAPCAAAAHPDDAASAHDTSAEGDPGTTNSSTQSVCDTSKDPDANIAGASNKKQKKKFRHGKKGHPATKDNPERNPVRRVNYAAVKGRKRTQSFPTISKFFLPYKRPRKDAFIPPTKFLLGGNISDPLNLNSLQDEDINRAMNAVTPESSPLPTPPRHKAKIDVIIPLNIRDPLNLMDPLDNEEYEKRLEMQQRKPRKRPKLRRRTTENTEMPVVEKAVEVKEEGVMKEPAVPEPSTSKMARKRSCSESENSQKGKDNKKLRRMDSLDKIVSPVVPQPGAWMRARPQGRPAPPERPASPHRPKPSVEGDKKLPNFHPKNSKYQYGNYDRYYGYRNLNAMMDVRLQVFEMHRHLFQNKDVLDIGCNVGHISMAVARTFGARSVIGIDIDPVLISRARKNLRSFIPVPPEPSKTDTEDHKKDEDDKKDCDKCETENCEDCVKDDKDQKKPGRKVRKPRKNRKALHKPELGQCFFPMSMPMLYGQLGNPPVETTPPIFPYNVTFKQGNYVPREDAAASGAAAAADCPQFDLILCLSTTKWLHLNWGDAGLKRAFKKMFNDLRPGGKLVLEAQNWASYKKKKRLTILSCVRLLGDGSYQRGTGQDHGLAIAQTTVSKYLTQFSEAVVTILLPRWIVFPGTEEERQRVSRKYREKHGLPDIIGAIDCTHVAIFPPPHPQGIQFKNRKGIHSINTQLPTIYENFNSIELTPKKFRDYLLSPEVGFSKCSILGVPQHASKGFRRPIQLYIKGDFTPSKARWSDAHAPSSHHKLEAELPIRTVYAPVEPAYRPSDDAPSCGAATPYSPNLDCCLDDSPFYNPRSDSYAPSYEPPRPTVYATLGSPMGGASPAASPVPSPASPHSPRPPHDPLPEPRAARVYCAPTPPYRPLED